MSPNPIEAWAATSGVKYDGGKPRPALLPARALLAVAEVLAFGAAKYPSADNWKRVHNARARYADAALRHVFSYLGGERDDPESGLHHLAHAVTCLLFLLAFDLDDDLSTQGAP